MLILQIQFRYISLDQRLRLGVVMKMNDSYNGFELIAMWTTIDNLTY